MDLEMTGLCPQADVILEMAIILTDAQLTPLGRPLRLDIWQPEAVLATMSPFVRDMHHNTGLLQRVRAATTTVADAQRQALELISSHAKFRRAILCGNSIHHDRMFLRAHMPHLDHFLHYRQIDVSAIKEVVRMWGGSAYAKSEAGRHTALGDIEQSIAELQHYRQQALVPALRIPAAPSAGV